MSFGFVSQPTVFNQDSLCDYWFGILKWSLLGSPVAAELKTMAPSPPEKELIVQQGRVEPYKSLLHPQLTVDRSSIGQAQCRKQQLLGIHGYNGCVMLSGAVFHSASPYPPALIPFPPLFLHIS